MKIFYRPEIDGLRAIAIISVILYHAEINLFGFDLLAGGFVGVDIFFVISGYLITLIILKELNTTNSFSYKKFIEKRIRRILPALLFAIILSLPLAWLFLLPGDFVDFSKSILFSLGILSNYFFHYSGQIYGAIDSLYKPFLHTWSLSIEAQFYIIFPLILFLIFKFLKKFLVYILIFLFFSSLIFAHYGSINFSSLNFYALPSRVWELLAGSILAVYEIKIGHRGENKKLTKILPCIGILLITHSILFFNDGMLHPSYFTLSPVIGSCLLIWFSNKDELITKLLSSKLLVGIGLISYSLYILHYPFFAFARIPGLIQGNLYRQILLGLIVVTFSIFSYHFIEKPVRNKEFKFINIFLILVFLISNIILINSFVIYKNGFEERFSKIYFKNNILNNELRAESWELVENHNFQRFQSVNRTKVLLVGDSHSKDLFNIFIQNPNIFKDYEFVRYGNKNTDGLNFDNYQDLKALKAFQISETYKQADILLISSFFKGEEEMKRLEEFINFFKDKKKLILTSNSNIYFNDFDKLRYKNLYNLSLFDYYLLNKSKKDYFIDKDLTLDVKFKINKLYFENRKIDNINSNLKDIAKKHRIKILNKEDFQCELEEKICYGITDGGSKIHYDYGHFTLKGAKFFGTKIHEKQWFEVD